MREIRQSGSEGGGAETNRPSRPLSATSIAKWKTNSYLNLSKTRLVSNVSPSQN